MKKRRIIRLGALLIVVILAVVAAWQWNNITAGLYYLRYSRAELDQRLADSHQSIAEQVEQLPGVSVQPLSDEQRSQLHSGELKEDEAIKIMVAEQSAEQPPPAPDTFTAEEAAEKRQRIAELIAEVYLLRDVYKAKLEEVKNAALADWQNLSEYQRTEKQRNALLSACISQATVLEQDCDSRMDAILSELGALLKELDEGSDLADQVKAAYAEEKAVTKAYYLNLAE